jgi:hypothetical protein
LFLDNELALLIHGYDFIVKTSDFFFGVWKGNQQTNHHYFSFFFLTLPMGFPELRITKEGLFSKIAQAFGYDDIDFESAEFSRAFCVRSKDKKFACGSLKIIAAIEDPPVIVRILTHLGLPTRAPPRAPAQGVDLFQTI